MEKMSKEEYQWNKKELMKHRNLPYMFSNEDLAISFIDMLREDMIKWSSSLSLELSELCANIEELKKKRSQT